MEKKHFNVLLVYPEFPDTFWSFKHALRFIGKKAASPPLGLLTVAALLPADWPKKLVDLNVRALNDEDLAWADMVMISAMVVQRESAAQVIDRCHAAGVKVVAGGPLFMGDWEQFDKVDTFVLNEAESTLPEFLKDLESGETRRVYTSGEFPDIRQSPVPLWQLLDLHQYNSMSVQFSRGCPYNCEFCNVTAMFGRKPRTKTTAQVIAELNALYSLGWRGSVFFVDDNFIGARQQVKNDLLPALIRWREGKMRRMSFYTQATIDLADDDDLMRMMVEAGFRMVFIGIETPEEHSLIECGKLQNRGRDLVESVKRIHRAGMQVQGGFIVGFDNDPPSIFQRQVELIQKSGIVTAMVGLLQALPDTRLYQRLKGENRLEGGSSGDNVDGTTNIVPVMNLSVLLRGYHYILQQIYAPKAYYERIRTFLQDFQVPRLKTLIDWRSIPQYIQAFFRAIYRLGIRGVERIQFWRIARWTLFHRPRAFATAITLAIYGFHFRRVYELHVQTSG